MWLVLCSSFSVCIQSRSSVFSAKFAMSSAILNQLNSAGFLYGRLAGVQCLCLLKPVAMPHGTSWLYNSVPAALGCVYPVETSTSLYNLYLDHPSQPFLASSSNLMNLSDPAQISHRNAIFTSAIKQAIKQAIKILWSINLSVPPAELVQFQWRI